MHPSSYAGSTATQPNPQSPHTRHPAKPSRVMEVLGIGRTRSSDWLERLPFSPADITLGTETELQTAVAGSRREADLAWAIEASTYYKNLSRRAASGDTHSSHFDAIEAYLDAEEGIRENSWVHFPRHTLNAFAESVFISDMRADYRGAGQISAYQKMALAAVVYAVMVTLLTPAVIAPVQATVGLRPLWNPGIITICQILWMGIFLYMGRSQVTGAHITFHVHKDRI